MGILLNPESPTAIELQRWERPWTFMRYPQMLYRAQRHRSGQWRVLDPEDEAFSRASTTIVQTDAEYQRAKADGWRDDPREALDYREALEQEIARAAAERHFSDQRLSAKAQAEARAADAATDAHLPEGPPVPPKRPWQRKVKPPTDAA
jgi:hypothetical protein